MIVIQGILRPSQEDQSTANYSVEVRLASIIKAEAGSKDQVILDIPIAASGRAGADGNFRVVIESEGELLGPVTLSVSAPNGVRIHRQQFSLEEILKPLELTIETTPPFTVAPIEDPTLGKRIRLTGSVFDERGRIVGGGLPVVILGVSQESGTAHDPFPLVVTETQSNGAFAGEWPSILLSSAMGRVGSAEPSPISLDQEGRLPLNILLVINLDDVGIPEKDEKDRCCDDVPPRAPDPADLTANPAAFSQDLGGRCVDLTIPNRVLEEFSYYTVVRTSEPNVQGVTLGLRRTVPKELLTDLLGVSVVSTAIGRNVSATVNLPTENLELDLQSAKALIRGDRPPSLANIERALWLSEVSFTKNSIDAGLRQSAGRVDLDADNPIDWDDTPTLAGTTCLSRNIEPE
jgi:hypothetical protein